MDRPKELQQLVDENPEQFELITQAIDLYRKMQLYSLYEVCAICDKVMSEEEKQKQTMYHYNFCCNSHADYREVFDTNSIRIKLGFPERRYFAEIKKP